MVHYLPLNQIAFHIEEKENSKKKVFHVFFHFTTSFLPSSHIFYLFYLYYFDKAYLSLALDLANQGKFRKDSRGRFSLGPGNFPQTLNKQNSNPFHNCCPHSYLDKFDCHISGFAILAFTSYVPMCQGRATSN